MINPKAGIILAHYTRKIDKKALEEEPFQVYKIGTLFNSTPLYIEQIIYIALAKINIYCDSLLYLDQEKGHALSYF